jgi:hypothetical protein
VSIEPLSNPRLIVPSTRVIHANERRAFDAIPGEVPFAKMLQAQNRISRIQPVDTYEPTSELNREPNREPEPSVSSFPALLPNLGEVLPVNPEAETQVVHNVQRQVYVPATGRILDLYL